MEKIRIQKFFTDNGIMSRRACEAEISAQRIRINGQIAVLGEKINPETDIVEYNGKTIKPAARTGRTYIMLNKPMGFVTTMSDEKRRPDAASLVADSETRIYPVGRLDMYSEGLLLFTNDGELANRLTHPSHSIPKVYSVKVKGEVGDEAYRILTSPMKLDGYNLRPVKVEILKNGEADRGGCISSVLRFTLLEGRNRQIRRMCEKAGISVMRLRRISEGELELGSLESGKWRYLTEKEIEYLKSI